MKSFLKTCLVILISFLMLRCVKPDDYKKYLDYGQQDYPGVIMNPKAFGGLNRVLLVWNPSADQTIKRYVIYWNSGRDSIAHVAQTTDPSKLDSVYIDNLSEENNYTLTAYSYNEQGVRSILTSINNVRVYGEYYIRSLSNRPIQSTQILRDTLFATWFEAEASNILTSINYTDTDGQQQSAELKMADTKIALPKFQKGTYLYYRSSFKPEINSPDIFYTEKYDSLKVSQ